MEVRLQKWGNSVGIRIPSNFLKALKLNKDEEVNMLQEEDKIIITKIKNKRISLKDRIKDYNENNLCKDFSWDDARGKEIW